MSKIRVVHYINQFFANIGGEEKADYPVEVREAEVIGPGLAFKQAFGEEAEIVATIICGDSYFNENLDKAKAEILEVVKKYVHRIKHVHLKDIRPEVVEQVKKENMSFLAGVRAGAFTIPGDGCINYDPVFKVLEEAGYEGYMVVEAEQDPAKANPLEYAIRARKFIAEKTGL